MGNVLLIISVLWIGLVSQAEPAPAPLPTPGPAARQPLYQLRLSDAILLGVVEGVTEFLPISSTGHLIILTDLLGLDNDFAFEDAAGEPRWYRKPQPGHPGELLTASLANDAYIVVIQFGAIAAIIPICWSQLMMMGRGVFRGDPRGLRLFLNVMIAFIPSAALGLLLHDWIDKHLFSRGAVIFGLTMGSILMFFADRRGRALEEEGIPTELTPHGAAWIGFLQCFSLWPGVGRPMTTIVGGYLVGLPPGPAAGFSFILGFVTLCAATLYKSYKSGPLIIEIFGWQSVIIGIVVAGVTAFFSVKYFIKLLLQEGLKPFAWYRLALAAALFFLID